MCSASRRIFSSSSAGQWYGLSGSPWCLQSEPKASIATCDFQLTRRRNWSLWCFPYYWFAWSIFLNQTWWEQQLSDIYRLCHNSIKRTVEVSENSINATHYYACACNDTRGFFRQSSISWTLLTKHPTKTVGSNLIREYMNLNSKSTGKSWLKLSRLNFAIMGMSMLEVGSSWWIVRPNFIASLD